MTQPLSPERLAEIEARSASCVPPYAPYRYFMEIAHADRATLLSEVKRMAGEIERLRAEDRSAIVAYFNCGIDHSKYFGRCPGCHAILPPPPQSKEV